MFGRVWRVSGALGAYDISRVKVSGPVSNTLWEGAYNMAGIKNFIDPILTNLNLLSNLSPLNLF